MSMSDETVDHVKELRDLAEGRQYGGLCDYLDEVADALEEATEARDAAYRGRAELIAAIARAHGRGAVLVYDADPETPGWPVIFIQAGSYSTGGGMQLSWHISPADLDLFQGIEQANAGDPNAPAWDGHDDAEKSRRIADIDLRA